MPLDAFVGPYTATALVAKLRYARSPSDVVVCTTESGSEGRLSSPFLLCQVPLYWNIEFWLPCTNVPGVDCLLYAR